MAAESKVPKRKRSRPSDWWAVNHSESSKQIGNNKLTKYKPTPPTQPFSVESSKNEHQNGQKVRVIRRSSVIKGKNYSSLDKISVSKTKDKNGPQKSQKNERHRRIKPTPVLNTHVISKLSGKNSDSQSFTKRRKNSRSARVDSETGKVDSFSAQEIKFNSDQNISDDELRFIRQKTKSTENIPDNLNTSLIQTGEVKDTRRTFDLSLSPNNSIKSPRIGLSEIEERENSIDHSDNDSLSSQKLTAITMQVSRYVIESKWNALPPDCVEYVAKLLQNIQLPIIASFNDRRRRTQASKALKSVSYSLVRIVSKKTLFPLSTRRNRKVDLDFRRITDYNRSLETQLTPALHANMLLNAALSDELESLKVEKEILVELEANSRKEMLLRNESARKLHPVFQTNYLNDIYSLNEDIGLELESAEIFGIKNPVPFQYYENLPTLLNHINNHVTNILKNIDQVCSVSETIAKTKATLQDTLFDQLSNLEYQEIFLGEE